MWAIKIQIPTHECCIRYKWNNLIILIKTVATDGRLGEDIGERNLIKIKLY